MPEYCIPGEGEYISLHSDADGDYGRNHPNSVPR